jgi:hypothetical protein
MPPPEARNRANTKLEIAPILRQKMRLMPLGGATATAAGE